MSTTVSGSISNNFEKFGKTILEGLTVINLKVLKIYIDIEYN